MKLKILVYLALSLLVVSSCKLIVERKVPQPQLVGLTMTPKAEGLNIDRDILKKQVPD